MQTRIAQLVEDGTIIKQGDLYYVYSVIDPYTQFPMTYDDVVDIIRMQDAEQT